MAAGLFECSSDQVDFKPPHFFVEIYTATDVANRRIACAVAMSGNRLTSDR